MTSVPVISTKISRPLAESLQEPDDGEPLDVIVELAPPEPQAPPAGSNQAEPVAARKATFAKHADPVVQAIRRLGGEVTGEAWISGSLRARVARAAVSALSDEAQVTRLDLPRAIRPDTEPRK